MFDQRIYNFSAGPSMLPLKVLERAGREITNYNGSGMSVMEMSHRSKVFAKLFAETKAKFRTLLQIPEEYEIMFLQGGASTQFSAIPLNLAGMTGKADYALTGNFSTAAWKEAKKYADVAVVPGSAFCSEGFCRLSYANSLENIQRGLVRIAAFVDAMTDEPQELIMDLPQDQHE